MALLKLFKGFFNYKLLFYTLNAYESYCDYYLIEYSFTLQTQRAHSYMNAFQFIYITCSILNQVLRHSIHKTNYFSLFTEIFKFW